VDDGAGRSGKVRPEQGWHPVEDGVEDFGPLRACHRGLELRIRRVPQELHELVRLQAGKIVNGEPRHDVRLRHL
jgi:hypothetical protein